MAIEHLDRVTFPFNDGRGISTSQLDGEFLARIEKLSSGRIRIHYVTAAGAQDFVNIAARDLGSARPGFLPTVHGSPQQLFNIPAGILVADIDIDVDGNLVVLRDDRHVNKIQLATTGFGNSWTARKIAAVAGQWVVAWDHATEGNLLASHNPTNGAVVNYDLTHQKTREVVALGRNPKDARGVLALKESSTGFLTQYHPTITNAGALAYTSRTGAPLGNASDVGAAIVSLSPESADIVVYLHVDGKATAYTYVENPNPSLVRASDADEVYHTHGPSFVGLALHPEVIYVATATDVITFVQWRDKFTDHPDTPAVIVPKQQLRGNTSGTALEFIKSLTLPAGITRVGNIPAAKGDAVINLLHDEYSHAGDPSDYSLTPGYVSPFFGYSDGRARDATGTLLGQGTPLAWVGGDLGTTDNTGAVTSWQPDYVGSHSRAWLEQFAQIKMGPTKYNLAGMVYDNGIWESAIVNPPTFPNGNQIALNFFRADGTAGWRKNVTFLRRAGLYWWDVARLKYSLLESGSLQNRGVHLPGLSYATGDVVLAGPGAYLATVDIAIGVAITDGKWLKLFGLSIDVAAALPVVTTVPRSNLVAVGAAADTGLSGPPHYRREGARDVVRFRADPLGAGRTGFTTLKLGDNIYQGKALPTGGALTPMIPGVVAFFEQPNAAGGSQLTLLSDTKAGSPLGALTSNIRVDLQGREAVVLSHAGLVNTRRQWVAVRLADTGSFLMPGEVYDLKLWGVTLVPPAHINLHPGDYLAPLIDPALLDEAIADAEKRLLQESENHRQIISIENDAIPEINVHNYRDLHIDHRSPRAWIGQRYPTGTTPATARSAFTVISGHWQGAYSIDPEFPGISDNDVYYSRVQHNFRKRVSGAWVSTGFSEFAAIYTNVTSHWLGERYSSNDAAEYVPLPIVPADNYFFYHRGERRVEQIENLTFVAPQNRKDAYSPHALVTADDVRKEFLADHTLYTDKNATGMHISPLEWIAGAKIEFIRALTAGDDDSIIACHLRWEERNPTAPTSKTQGHHRSFSGQIDGLTFRTLGERVAGVNGNSRSMTESADWYVRQPNWRPAGNVNNRAEMRISYGRERLADGRDAIRFLLAAGDTQSNWADNTRIFNFQGRFILHH